MSKCIDDDQCHRNRYQDLPEVVDDAVQEKIQLANEKYQRQATEKKCDCYL